ncbi:MAG TPA: SDR family NAD(P)-dependent oxidoreductase [Burkholderiales bacterium]|jgi:NAD(P)-dependent dehydrogenase (short-subunit alcohol dehydrogenase family)|nr:SDR family NAD(P)-dependent oxidoreductase [Burkholderiales bacterium]
MSGADLKGKVAWITGGGSGIGLAGALELARAGARVVISGRTQRTNESGLAQLKAVGEAEAIQLDVSDKGAVAHTAADIEKRHGRIDILVTSAGTNIGGAKRNFKTMSLEGWDDVVRINLDGLFYCCHAVIPGMRARKDGLIINISSWAGRYASVLTGPAYNATKRAVIAVTESINMEECMNGIRATSILPGEVATPIMEKRPVPPTPAERARMAQPEDFGAAILFVATMPARTCVNEVVIAPTWNRFYVGGLEK